MKKISFTAVRYFLVVAEEKSFKRAAAQLGISSSALSHSIQSLEDDLGIRLLTRTTRSVSVTQAGLLLKDNVGRHIENIDAILKKFPHD